MGSPSACNKSDTMSALFANTPQCKGVSWSCKKTNDKLILNAEIIAAFNNYSTRDITSFAMLGSPPASIRSDTISVLPWLAA